MGGKVSVAVADVSVEAEVNRAVAELEAAHRPANVLFNHAGTIVIKPFLETTAEEWDWLHAVNVKSMFLMTKAVLPKNAGRRWRVNHLHFIHFRCGGHADGGSLLHHQRCLPPVCTGNCRGIP